MELRWAFVGIFKAYAMHHKRTTIKVWLIVYWCMFTSTTSVKVMDDYSTQSFIQSFIRFSCELVYPKFMLIDEGSQLVKGCQTMQRCASRTPKGNFTEI